MFGTAFTVLAGRRSDSGPDGRPERPALTRQDLQGLLREELDRLEPLSC